MSHHFDTPTAREAPVQKHFDRLYASRFDLDGDAREELSFKARSGAVVHADDHDRAHVQSFEVRRASGADGDLVVAGHTGRVVETETGVKAFAGLAAGRLSILEIGSRIQARDR
jgi:hypothetical protein